MSLKGGHYQIALPFKDEFPQMPSNRIQVEQRITWLKKRLLKNPQFHKDYTQFIEDLLKRNHARKVPQDQLDAQNGRVRYIPHHGVYHPHKPGKIRVVFDCSCKFKGSSLNDYLLTGPDLTNNLVGVLNRFRLEPIAISADIESMFYQVQVTEPDRDYLRFLWWPEGDLNKEPEEYQMLVYIFGATSSPSCSCYALLQTAEDNKNDFDVEVIDTVRRNFYVDDCLKSEPTIQSAIRHVSDLRILLSKGGFHLTKWSSNDRSVLKNIPVHDRAKEVKTLDLEQDKLPIERVLGMQWCAESDQFKFKLMIKYRPPTRRGILSVVASIYDPLGFLAPIILPAKILLQDLNRLKVGWDDEIPKKHFMLWQQWLEDLPKLSEFSVQRCFKPPNFQVKSAQLNGSVSYIRQLSSDDQIHCSFVFGKSRLSPLKTVTIPRLELTAATVSVRLDSLISKELDHPVPISDTFFWTDSTTVLRYVENETKRYQTFVANRITYIRERSTPSQWKYVESKKNTADCASRGLTVDSFLSTDSWIKGPDFIWSPEYSWPKRPPIDDVINDDPEVKRETITFSTTTETMAPRKCLCSIVSKFSSWDRAKRIVAWILRYRRKLPEARNKRRSGDGLELQNHSDPKSLRLQVNELENAEREIIKCLQACDFPDEVAALTPKEVKNPQSQKTVVGVKRSSSLSKLNPVWKNGILVVGGRLQHAIIPENSKHQMIISKGSHVADLIIRHFHHTSGHLGRNYVLSQLRKKYWIPQANSAVRKILSKCLLCRKLKGRVMEQRMADLPADRLVPDQPPFTCAGIDYFGPFFVRRGRSMVKKYGVIFSCLATRAVHIEVSDTLDTDSFLMALRRFLARRGNVKEIRSDNGTNFTSGKKELREAILNWNQSKVHNQLLQKNIEWIFNPPSGSHHGGVWERLIRTIRRLLKALLKEQVVDDEGFRTFMCEVEGIMNARPITTVSDDINDPDALTPNHLLIARSNQSLPPGVFKKEDVYSKRRWRQTQYLADIFWRRWTREYIPLLQERQKWLQPQRNAEVNNIVLLVDYSLPRNTWPMVRVVSIHPDKQGLVQVVTVKTKTSVLKRPISKLVLLLEADKLRND